MSIIVEQSEGGWQRFQGRDNLNPRKVARLVDEGVWGPVDLSPLGLAVAVPFDPGIGQVAVGPERFEEYEGEVWQLYDTAPAPPPEPRRLGKSVILSRITDEQLETVLALMSPMQMERWRSPDAPTVSVEDPEVVGLVLACGADPAVVLAPEDAP